VVADTRVAATVGQNKRFIGHLHDSFSASRLEQVQIADNSSKCM
jgi:hypothetical protein